MDATAEQRESFAKIMANMTLAKRREVAAEIRHVQEALGSTDDFTADRRKVMWSNNGNARKTIEEKRIYEVLWRGNDPVMCNIEEAAAQVRKKVTSLRTYLAKGGGVAHFNIEDEIVTVSKKE